MAGDIILIPLRRGDRLEHVLPYIETIAKPDTKVVFLAHYASGFERHLMRLSGCNRVRSEFFSGTDSRNDPPERPGKEQVSPASETLSRLGAKIEMAVYAGGFRKAVREYMRKGDVQLVLLPGGRSNWLMRVFQRMFLIHQPFKLPTLPPVLLFRAGNAGRRQR